VTDCGLDYGTLVILSGVRIFHLVFASRLPLGSTQPSIQWILGVLSLSVDWMTGVWSLAGEKDFSLSLCIQTGLGSTQPHVQWVFRVLSLEVKCEHGRMLTTRHLHLVLKSTMSMSYTSSAPPKCLHSVYWGHLYFTLLYFAVLIYWLAACVHHIFLNWWLCFWMKAYSGCSSFLIGIYYGWFILCFVFLLKMNPSLKLSVVYTHEPSHSALMFLSFGVCACVRPCLWHTCARESLKIVGCSVLNCTVFLWFSGPWLLWNACGQLLSKKLHTIVLGY
jgi:hypothetical protein